MHLIMHKVSRTKKSSKDDGLYMEMMEMIAFSAGFDDLELLCAVRDICCYIFCSPGVQRACKLLQ